MKLLVVLGAGSSVAQKMPAVSDIDREMRNWSNAWPLVTTEGDYFDWLLGALTAYYAVQQKAALRRSANFETVLGLMADLGQFTRAAPFGDPLSQIVGGTRVLPPGVASPPFYGASQAVSSQQTNLLDQLAKHFRARSRALNRRSRAYRDYRALLAKLSAETDLGVYNLNYDDVARSALPTAFFGFDPKGYFDPSGVHQRAGWGFVYHVHGSVHYTLHDTFGDAIVWKKRLSGSFSDAPQALSPASGADGRTFAKSTLIAGGYKLDRLLLEPFATMHASLIRHVHDADAILVGGYGFGDAHINRALQSRLTRPGSKPRTAVLTFSPDIEDRMELRGDAWSHELCQTLYVDSRDFTDPNGSIASVRDLKRQRSFELSRQHDIAIWHGGFQTAVTRVGDLIAWLRGAPHAVLAP